MGIHNLLLNVFLALLTGKLHLTWVFALSSYDHGSFAGSLRVSEWCLLGGIGLGTDISVEFFVHSLEISTNSLPFGELSVECFLIFGLEVLHVVFDVTAKDAMSVNTSVIRPLLVVLAGAREAAGLVWDVKTAITGALHGGEDLVSIGATHNSDVESGFEWTSGELFTVVATFVTILLHIELGSGDLTDSLVELFEADLLEQSTG